MYSEEIDSIVYKELECIRRYPHWVCAWWKPEYERNRRKELAQDITSKNKDIDCIEKRQITSG
jgi:hypothetical protein